MAGIPYAARWRKELLKLTSASVRCKYIPGTARPAEQVAHPVLMEKLLEKAADNPFWFAAYVYYADEADMKRMLSRIGELDEKSRRRINKLLLSKEDSLSTARWLFPYSLWQKYARRHSMDPEDLLKQMVPDNGFDENGELVLASGDHSYTFKLQNNGRPVPAAIDQPPVDHKGLFQAEPEIFDKLEDLEKDLERQLAVSKALLSDDFLTGKSYSPEEWQEFMAQGTGYRHYALKLVFCQDDHYYIPLKNGAFVNAQGEPYRLTDGKITLAHPMEMEKEEITLWKGYLEQKHITQPFPPDP